MNTRRNSRPSGTHAPDTDGWWKQVLAGAVATTHPVHGDELKVKLTEGRLVLWGEVPSKRDRDQLVREARERIGNGLHEYDAKGLRIRPKDEKRGLLGQTIAAAYSHRDTAELALQFFLEHTGNKPIRAKLVDRDAKLEDEVPFELVDDARKQLGRGLTLLVVEVDETEAFRARSLLEEDTRSVWTSAAPPRALAGST